MISMGSRVLNFFAPHHHSPGFTHFPGLMDTCMDTKIFIVFPLHILQLIIGDDIVSSEDRGRLVTGD